MKSLQDLPLASFYSKDTDVLDQFYYPCIESSATYLRVSGYFSSAIFDLAGTSFYKFFDNGGRMLLICSPFLSAQDTDAILPRPVEFDHEYETLRVLLSSEKEKETAKVLAFLISRSFVKIKIAAPGLMHEKFGIFERDGDAVSFIGSINETYMGWGADGNHESFDVFVSWSDRDNDRVERHRKRFSDLWNDLVPGVRVRSPSAEFLHLAHDNAEAGQNLFNKRLNSEEHNGFRYDPLDYQSQVINAWKDNRRRGIVKFCTGAGKTVVGMLAIKWATDSGYSVLVVVPSKTLLHQWASEISDTFASARVLLAGDGNAEWRNRGLLESYLRSHEGDFAQVVITTTSTGSSQEFVARASKVKDALLVGDEVHQMGAPHNSNLLRISANFRLGLSATPTRYGDEEGTSKILDYFGGVLEPVIDIPTAIKKGRLVPYQYNFEIAYLNEDEQELWNSYTKKISRLAASGASSGDEESGNARIVHLLIQRARIAKKAADKPSIALSILQEHFERGQRWLFFLEDRSELETFKTLLETSGFSCMVYDGSTNTTDRNLVVQHLISRGGIVLSMRCLDEGVDIPAISHAVILASSQNPRQFVQRRGRVLRHAGKSKKRAYIWDVLALPEPDSLDTTKALVFAEVARAAEFAAYAENSSIVEALRSKLVNYGLSLEECLAIGDEDDSAINNNDH